MKNYEPALSKETLKTVDNKIKQSKKKRSKSLLGNRLENLSINSVCPYLTLFNGIFPTPIKSVQGCTKEPRLKNSDRALLRRYL